MFLRFAEPRRIVAAFALVGTFAPPQGFPVGDRASFAWTPTVGAPAAFYRLVYTKRDALPTAVQLDVTTTAGTLGGLETGAAYDVRLYVGSANGCRRRSPRSAWR